MPDDTPGLNLQGYFQDKKGKTATPVSKGSRHEFGPPPSVTSNAAQRKGNGKGSSSSKKAKAQGDGSESEETQ
jgi:hypothetical protein